MNLPTREEARNLLHEYVTDPYQRHHAHMVSVAMEGYAQLYREDLDLWYLTGYLHDLDFEKFPKEHPQKSLELFKELGYPDELIHAVEAHAYGHNGFKTIPESKLAACLIACDEISGIFYAYQKMNPVSYGEMKVSSIKKRLREKTFAAKIDREIIYLGCERLGVEIEDHVGNLIKFFTSLGISDIIKNK